MTRVLIWYLAFSVAASTAACSTDRVSDRQTGVCHDETAKARDEPASSETRAKNESSAPDAEECADTTREQELTARTVSAR